MVLGEAGAPIFIVAKFPLSRRIEMNGRDHPALIRAEIGPGGGEVFPAQDQVAAWDAGRASAGSALGRFPRMGQTGPN